MIARRQTVAGRSAGTSGDQASGTAVLELSGISRRFGKVLANDNISLTLHRGEILGLLGENGAGKTTLVNILFGHYTADSGEIRVDGKPLRSASTDAALRAGIGMVHQHFTLADNMTVLENLMLGTEPLWSLSVRKGAAVRRLGQLQRSLGLSVDLETRVSDLSIGERQRVEILKALYRGARILILDEPTAVLTPQEVESLFALLRRMAEDGLSIILISHKLDEVLSLTDRVAVLRHGRVVGSRTTRSVDRDSLAGMIVGREVVRPARRPLPPGDIVIALEGAALADPSSGRLLLRGLNLEVRQHQIVGLAGVSGNGQRELAAVLSGLRNLSNGKFEFCGQPITRGSAAQLQSLGAARIPEDRHAAGVIGEMTIWENLLLEDLGRQPCWRWGRLLNRNAARARAASLVDSFDIRCAGVEAPVGLLSGGNIQKVILARNCSRDSRFVLANQPARGLDEGAIAFVHRQLLKQREQGAGVLLITEDLDELLRLSDQVVVMRSGTLTQPLPAESLSVRQLGLLMTGSADSPAALDDTGIDSVRADERTGRPSAGRSRSPVSEERDAL